MKSKRHVIQFLDLTGMISNAVLVKAKSTDPYFNLAIEEYLFENLNENQIIFYLWQNKNTVVIGKNQNSEKECRLTLLQEEGGTLVRRMSGGGAVYHDLGNLNFTFISNVEDYNVSKQFDVILNALCQFQIFGQKSGRNDLEVEGKKFSGNAFYTNGNKSYHHGTLLVNVDKEKMSRYLNPSILKMKSKSVSSTKARVINLNELNPDITVDSLSNALIKAFEEVYQLKLIDLDERNINHNQLQSLVQKYQSFEWIFGQKIPFTIEFTDRFNWGEISIQLDVERGIIKNANIYSDSLDVGYIQILKDTLIGISYLDRILVLEKLKEFSITVDIAVLLKEDEHGLPI